MGVVACAAYWVLADSPRQAAALHLSRHPGHGLKEVDGLQVVGRCEASGEVIFSGDKYVTDEHGMHTLWKHLH
jgi:hypothetical protein